VISHLILTIAVPVFRGKYPTDAPCRKSGPKVRLRRWKMIYSWETSPIASACHRHKIHLPDTLCPRAALSQQQETPKERNPASLQRGSGAGWWGLKSSTSQPNLVLIAGKALDASRALLKVTQISGKGEPQNGIRIRGLEKARCRPGFSASLVGRPIAADEDEEWW